MNTWFSIKVKYIKQLEDGRLKSVTEPYLIDSVSFTDAEARIYEEVGQHVRGEFIIKGISRVDFADVFYYDDSEDWYKCKLTYVAVDADEGKEKKISSNFLVTASSVKEAYERISESLSDMTVSFEVPSIVLTNIVEVIPYDPSSSTVPEGKDSKSDSYEDHKNSKDEDLEDIEEDDDFDEDLSSDDDEDDEDNEVDEDDVMLEDKTDQ